VALTASSRIPVFWAKKSWRPDCCFYLWVMAALLIARTVPMKLSQRTAFICRSR
jgi:hypothetical protein